MADFTPSPTPVSQQPSHVRWEGASGGIVRGHDARMTADDGAGPGISRKSSHVSASDPDVEMGDDPRDGTEEAGFSSRHATTAKQRTSRPENFPRPCATCGRPCRRLCKRCRDIAWCDPRCQAADWPVHRLVCRRLAVFLQTGAGRHRPSPNHLRTMLFPVDRSRPRFVWLEQTTNTRGVDLAGLDGFASVQSPLVNISGAVKVTKISRRQHRQQRSKDRLPSRTSPYTVSSQWSASNTSRVDRDIFIAHRRFAEHSPLNASIWHLGEPGVAFPWSGPLVAYATTVGGPGGYGVESAADLSAYEAGLVIRYLQGYEQNTGLTGAADGRRGTIVNIPARRGSIASVDDDADAVCYGVKLNPRDATDRGAPWAVPGLQPVRLTGAMLRHHRPREVTLLRNLAPRLRMQTPAPVSGEGSEHGLLAYLELWFSENHTRHATEEEGAEEDENKRRHTIPTSIVESIRRDGAAPGLGAVALSRCDDGALLPVHVLAINAFVYEVLTRITSAEAPGSGRDVERGELVAALNPGAWANFWPRFMQGRPPEEEEQGRRVDSLFEGPR